MTSSSPYGTRRADFSPLLPPKNAEDRSPYRPARFAARLSCDPLRFFFISAKFLSFSGAEFSPARSSAVQKLAHRIQRLLLVQPVGHDRHLRALPQIHG